MTRETDPVFTFPIGYEPFHKNQLFNFHGNGSRRRRKRRAGIDGAENGRVERAHNMTRLLLMSLLVVALLTPACDEDEDPILGYPNVTREEKLPADVAKRAPETDPHPPILHTDEFEAPVPLPGEINTAGAEDSPFVLPDGNTLYFFFTPDVRVPPERQVIDEVSGVWASYKNGDAWSEAERVWLQAPGKLALDGAVCVQGDEMWFASAREGFTGVNMFTAKRIDGKWSQWTYAGDRLMKEIQIGEVHIHGDDLYFHSARPGTKGDWDIWITTRDGSSWSDPVNVDAVNTTAREGYPFVSSDGNELWFTRTYMGTPGIFRSVKAGDVWSAPELIVSQLAGEPTLDDAGNLYFVHHYYEEGVMIEADIYLARKK